VTHPELDAAVSRLETAMAQMETRLTIRMFGVSLTVGAIQTAVLLGVLKLWQ